MDTSEVMHPGCEICGKAIFAADACKGRHSELERLEDHYEAVGNPLPLLAALMDQWGISKGKARN